ncbi:MAG: MFS transporter [Dehalococcoidia bacterium]
MVNRRAPYRDYMQPPVEAAPPDYMRPASAGGSGPNGGPRRPRRLAPFAGDAAAVAVAPLGARALGGFVPSMPAAALAPAPARAPAPQRSARPGFRQAFVSFKQRDFRYLGLSTLAVGFGQWAQQLGLPLLTLELTGSATQLGFLSFFRGFVGIATGPIGGVLADRYSRRTVILASTVASMVQALVLAALILVNRIELWHVYAFAFSGGLIQSLTQPARQAFVYDVSTDDTLQNAIVMSSFVQNLARISGPPLIGASVVWGIGAPFVIMAATQVVATFFTLLIGKQTRQGRPVRGSAAGQVIEGFRISWQDRRILGLIVVHSIPPLLILAYLPFIAIISRDVLHQGATGYGLMISMVGWGSIIGMFALALVGDPAHKGRLMMVGFLGYSTFLVAFSFSTNFILSLSLLGIAGLFFSVAQALNNTLIQVAAPNAVRGRVMAVWQMSGGLQPVGALPMGIAIAAWGPQLGIGAFMIAATLAFLVFLALWPSVRRM